MNKSIISFHFLVMGLLCFITQTFTSTTKSKIAIVSLFDAGYKQIGQYSDWNKKAYARKHGYDIYLHHELLDLSRPPAWSKIPAIEMHLHDYEWIYWSDADSLIMNDEIRLESIIDDRYDLIITQETTKKNLNTGSFLIRNSDWSRQLLKDMYKQEQFINANGYWEQAALKHLLKINKDLLQRIKVINQRIMNSHISEPGGQFQPGDFVIHFYTPINKAKYMADYYNLALNFELQKITHYSTNELVILLNEINSFEQNFAQEAKQYAPLLTQLINQYNFKKCCLIGAFSGDVSEYILQNSSAHILYSIDAYQHSNSDNYNTSKQHLEILLYKVGKRLAIFDERSVLIPVSSIEASKTFKAHELDFLFLDNKYSYTNMLENLNVWFNKVKAGGIISGKNYLLQDSIKAVYDFCALKSIKLNHDEKKKIWWIIKP